MIAFNRVTKLLQFAYLQSHKVPIWNLAATQSVLAPGVSKSNFSSGAYGPYGHILKPNLTTETLSVRILTSVRCLTTDTTPSTSKKTARVKGGKGPTPQKKFVKFDYSGDLQKLKDPVKEETLFGFNEIDSLKDEPEELQRIYSLEFADGFQRVKHEKWKLQEHLTEVCGPFNIYEKQIARDTVHIRHLIKHCLQYKRDKKSKVILIEKIAKRKKKLKYLRKLDFERFLWLLKTLKIQYIPNPAYLPVKTKSGLAKQEARNKAIALRDSKINELKEKLNKEYADFKVHKEKVLAEIDKDIEDYGLDKGKIKKDVEQKMREKLKQ